MKIRALDPLLYPVHKDNLHTESRFVENFYELITQSIEPPFAISVDGLWGTGKTTVMKMLERRLNEGGYSTFWFNPWEYHKTDSVVLAFLQSFAIKHKDHIDELQESGGKMFKVLLKAGISAALKIYTKGNISLQDVEKDFKEIENGQETLYESYKDSIQTIKKEFQELVKRVGAKYTNKTIIIFFDDLDRCLPDDAIQLLEALKNLFVTSECSVIFVCGIDTRVAKNFIRKHYSGLEENFAINYFRKIFNLTISMPSSTSLYKLLQEYIQNLYGWNPEKASDLANMIYACGLQAEMSSVRKYLNVANNLHVFQKFNPDYSFNPENDFIVCLLIVKEAWQSLYEQLVQEALKNRLEPMNTVVKILRGSQRESEQLSSEQERYLETYFMNTDYPFHNMVLADVLSQHPTLA